MNTKANSTEFLLLDMKNGKGKGDVLQEPILASFPNRTPSAQELQELKLCVKQQKKDSDDEDDDAGEPMFTKRRRVIVGEHNNIEYTATTFGPQSAARAQCQDYYLCVIDQKNPKKVHMMSVDTPYQFQQKISKFQERFGVTEDNEEIKAMTHMGKKVQVVKDFGVLKAKRATNSLLTNKIADDGIINREGTGVRDKKILDQVDKMDQELQDSKKKSTQDKSKKNNYSRQSLLDEGILGAISHQEVYKALQELTTEQLNDSPPDESLLSTFSSFAGISLTNSYKNFERIGKKTDKKQIIKAYIYLDALIKLHRSPKQIHSSIDGLSQRMFQAMSTPAIQLLLEKFTSIQQENRAEAARFNKHKQFEDDENKEDEGEIVKFVKTKEKSRILMLHLIGVAIMLSGQSRLRASTLTHMLKKDTGDLKQYLKELGVRVESIPGTKKQDADLMLHFDGCETRRGQKKDEKAEEAGEDKGETQDKDNAADESEDGEDGNQGGIGVGQKRERAYTE